MQSSTGGSISSIRLSSASSTLIVKAEGYHTAIGTCVSGRPAERMVINAEGSPTVCEGPTENTQPKGLWLIEKAALVLEQLIDRSVFSDEFAGMW